LLAEGKASAAATNANRFAEPHALSLDREIDLPGVKQPGDSLGVAH